MLGLVTREPDRASALLHAIVEIARRYDLKEEEFLRAALRSYQEIHENYFPELEEAAATFLTEFGPRYGFDETPPIPLATLEKILRRALRRRGGRRLSGGRIPRATRSTRWRRRA